MRARRTLARPRRFKRTSDRRLSKSDLLALDFLWTWKVASTPMLKLVAYKDQSEWWAYKALRQLKKEKYIQVLPRGKFLEQELWALTELGFEIVLMDRDDIQAYRYKPHAPAHDYFATCLQLGNLWTSKLEKNFLTEQMLASLSRSNFPKEFTENPDHVPDGITVIIHGAREAVIGYEVDLNLKDEIRYHSTLDYWKAAKAHLVVWLVRNQWIANRITKVVHSDYGDNDFLESKVVFILLDDFKKLGWEAEVIGGKFKDVSIRKLHENLVQSLTREPVKLTQEWMIPIFFPKFKSPKKTIICKEDGESKID